MKHFIGIDIPTTIHKVKTIDEKSNQKSSSSITNDFYGFEELNKKLASFEGIKIGIEQLCITYPF